MRRFRTWLIAVAAICATLVLALTTASASTKKVGGGGQRDLCAGATLDPETTCTSDGSSVTFTSIATASSSMGSSGAEPAFAP